MDEKSVCQKAEIFIKKLILDWNNSPTLLLERLLVIEDLNNKDLEPIVINSLIELLDEVLTIGHKSQLLMIKNITAFLVRYGVDNIEFQRFAAHSAIKYDFAASFDADLFRFFNSEAKNEEIGQQLTQEGLMVY